MTKKSLIPGLRAKIHRLRFTSPDETFQLALDAMLTEFRRRTRERLDEMRGAQFQNSGNQFADRLGVYRPLIKRIGEDYIDCLKTILLPNCGIISPDQKNLLAKEFQRVVIAQVDQAKEAETRFAHSVGRPDMIHSIILPLESIFFTENGRIRDNIESIIKQANLTLSTKNQAERKKNIFQTIIDVAKKLILGI